MPHKVSVRYSDSNSEEREKKGRGWKKKKKKSGKMNNEGPYIF